MSHRDGLRRASVALLGVALLALAVANVFLSDAELWLRLVQSGLPIGLSLIFLAFGVVLWERREKPAAMVIITAWAVAGSVVTGALAVWLLAVITFQNTVIRDPTFVVSSSATVGATFGGAAGFYHAQLQETTSELKQQNVRLDEFASIVSHDLRNPLSVAMGGLDLAKETGEEADFQRVRNAHERMERMIAELLTLSQKGKDVTDLEPVSLEAIVNGARATVAADIDVTVREDMNLHADPDRLTALLENLFRNAAEHAGPDPTVTVGTLDDAEGFYVADDGPGIPPDEQKQVFEHGYTTASSGTGIGLVIVRRIADAHGWNVTVTDSADGGARFEFRV